MSMEEHIFAAIERNDELDGTARRIAEVVIANGEDGLTPRQKFVFERYVLGKFVKECQNGCHIPWDEMYEAHHNGGFCFYCYDQMTKDRDE